MIKFDENQNMLRQFSKELYKDDWHEKLDPETQILFWREVKQVFHIFQIFHWEGGFCVGETFFGWNA